MENLELNTTAKYMKAEILFVEGRVELAVPTQSRPTKIQNRQLGVGDGGSFKKNKRRKRKMKNGGEPGSKRITRENENKRQ